MGCLGSSELVDQEKLFEQLYSSMKLKDALKNFSGSDLKKKQLVLYIYYNVSTQFLKSFRGQINEMQKKIKQSQVRVVSLQKLAQFVKSMEVFWKEVIQAKNRIKEFAIKSEEQLKKLNDSINMKIKTKMQDIDNNNLRSQQVQEKTQKMNQPKVQKRTAQHNQKKVKNKQIQRNLQASCEIQVQQKAEQSPQFQRLFQESKLTRQESLSNLTYSIPRNALQLAQLQKQLGQMKKLYYRSSQYEVTHDKSGQTQIGIDVQKKILILQNLFQNKQNQLQRVRNYMNQLVQQNSSLVEEIIKKNTQIQSLRESVQQLKQLTQSRNRTIQTQSANLHRTHKADNLDVAINSSDLSKTNCSEIKESNYLTILKYFGHSNLLPDFQNQIFAIKLRRQLTEMFTKKIRSTKLLYAFDPLSQLHYDRYIKNKQNLLLLVKINQLNYIGGFVGQVDQNQDVSDSFIFSIGTEKLPIKLVAQEKIKKIDYESGFLNFGNGEIKIICRSLKLSCNVNGFLRNYGGQKEVGIESFLGDKERSRQVQGYEIYEIQLDSQV